MFAKSFGWTFAVFLILALRPAPVGAGEGAMAEIRARGTLRAGFFAPDTPPFYFTDKRTGEYTGYDVDLARDLAKSLGVRLEISKYGPPFAKLTDALDEGRIDILISYASVTPERAAKYSAVIYEYTNFSLLLDLPRLEKDMGRELIEPADLDVQEARILVQRNTPFVGILKKYFPNATQAPIDSNNNVQIMVDAMDRGEAFAAFDRELVFLIYSRVDPAGFARFLLHPLPEIVNPVGIIMTKGSDLAPEVQRFVDGRDETMELAEIIDKYMTFGKK